MENKISPNSKSLDYFIHTNLLLCKIVGIVPKRLTSFSPFRRFIIYFHILFIYFAVNTIFIPEVLMIIVNWGDIVVLTNTGCIALVVAQILFKISYVLWHRGKGLALYEFVGKLWNVTEDKEDEKAIEKYAEKARLGTIIFSLAGLSNNIFFSIAAVFSVLEMRRNENNATDYISGMPYAVWYGYEPLSWSSLKIAFCGQFPASVLCVIGIVALDSSMMTLILHLCGQFHLIQCWIGKIGCRMKKEIADGNFNNLSIPLQNKYHRDFAKCIEHHKRLLLFAKEVEEFLGPVILMQFTVSGMGICLSGFALKSSGTSFNDFLKFAVCFIATIVQLLIWYWPGDVLITESRAIGQTIYANIPWYLVPNELKKDLCLVIVRSQKECRMSAMNFQVMSIKALGGVFNTAMSYFTLLAQIQLDE